MIDSLRKDVYDLLFIQYVYSKLSFTKYDMDEELLTDLLIIT